MEKEKSMYMNSPDSTLCTKAKVTGDSKLVIPKPDPLIGGTEVYQKNNSTYYWYCRIKEGIEEYMYLFFGDLTENDLLYEKNGRKREFVTDRERVFKSNVLKSLKNKPKECGLWVPKYLPLNVKIGNVYCVLTSREMLLAINSYQWKKNFKEYYQKNGSQEDYFTIYQLLLLRYLKDGIANLEELADISVSLT